MLSIWHLRKQDDLVRTLSLASCISCRSWNVEQHLFWEMFAQTTFQWKVQQGTLGNCLFSCRLRAIREEVLSETFARLCKTVFPCTRRTDIKEHFHLNSPVGLRLLFFDERNMWRQFFPPHTPGSRSYILCIKSTHAQWQFFSSCKKGAGAEYIVLTKPRVINRRFTIWL